MKKAHFQGRTSAKVKEKSMNSMVIKQVIISINKNKSLSNRSHLKLRKKQLKFMKAKMRMTMTKEYPKGSIAISTGLTKSLNKLCIGGL